MNVSDVGPSDGAYLSASVTNHSNFSPAKPPGKLPKPPKAPEKPLMPYMRYSREIWESVKAAHPDQKLSEIGKVIGRMWRELAVHEKQKYIDDYDLDKVKYAEAFKAYQTSPAYQQYLLTKEKYHAEEREMSRVKTWQKPAEARVLLPTCEPDEVGIGELDGFQQRQLAAARYHRNQRLLLEVFNDTCVPDMRQIITVPRLISIKRQVDTLTTHQKKIDGEIGVLVETFESKKRRLEESTHEFQQMLDKYKKPAVTVATYSTMVEDAERQLLAKYKVYIGDTEKNEKSNPPSKSDSPADSTSANSNAANDEQKNASAPNDTSSAPIPVENGKVEVKAEWKEESEEAANGPAKSTDGASGDSEAAVAMVNGDEKKENGMVSAGSDEDGKNE